jgi:hypothetical protein
MPNVHFPDVKTFATYLHLLPTENGEFVAGGRSDYWSATQKDDSNVYALYLDTTHSFWTAYNDSTALSVRCFKTM